MTKRPSKIKVRYLRSVRLEADLSGGESDDYVITPQVRLVLRRVLSALRVNGTERALTLTGPYGTGKSAFALFLSRLVSHPTSSALRQLEAVDGELALEVRTILPRPLLPVVLTLRRARIGTLLLEALVQAGSGLTGAGDEVQSIGELLAAGSGDSRDILQAVERLKAAALRQGFGGLLIVFDELGKGLEYEARYGSDDIFLLQELAEVAARSANAPLLFIGILHQGFEQYGEHLMASARKEWGKVQGRFADVAFLEPPEQQMRLAAQAVAGLDPAPLADLRDQSERAGVALLELGQAPKTIPAAEFAALARAATPLHPVSLMALPYLFRRFAQNERSLFAYLLSGEPHAVPALWATYKTPELIRVSELFDYFVENLLPSLSRHLHARRWLEVLDAVQRVPDLPGTDTQVLKTVGLLGILADMGALQATPELLSVALTDEVGNAEVQATLERLQQKSLLVYRAYNQTYRIWEGSDIDMEARLEEGRRLARANLDLAGLLERYLPRRPLVGRRHSFHTGTLRYFEVHYAPTPAAATAVKPDAGGEGVLLCALPSGAEDAAEFRRWAQSPEVAQREDLIVVIPERLETLREAALELHALHWLRASTPELQSDRVARREVSERLAQIDATLADNVAQLLDPRPHPEGSSARYWYLGEDEGISTPRRAVEFLSDVLDTLYAESPHILNELINRRAPSSAAAGGRRSLIEAMFDPQRRGQARLGMPSDSFRPERSMYESVLRFCQLHVPVDPENEAGEWHFVDPPQKHYARVRPVWDAMTRAIFGAGAPLNVAELFRHLNAPPYGLTAGLFPILLAAFMQAHPHEISFYREGTFIPEPGIADMEVLIRRPELFAVMGSELGGARAAVVERLARGYRTEPSLVAVVRALYKGVRSLPETAHRTGRLPPEVMHLRDAFTQARSPEQLLFSDIPAALGLPALSEEDAGPEQVEAFFAALNAANTTWAKHVPQQTAEARHTLLDAFGFAPDDTGWQALVEQATQLRDRPLPTSLRPLVSRLSAVGEPDNVLDGVLALVAGRSPRSWTDADAERFSTQARSVAQTYRVAAEQLGHATPAAQRQADEYGAKLRSSLGLGPTPLAQEDKAALRLALLGLLQELD